MAAFGEVAAAEFLQGLQQQKLILHRSCHKQKRYVLCGSVSPRRSSTSCISNGRSALEKKLISKTRALVSGSVTSTFDEESNVFDKAAGELIHFYRVPLIRESATDELLKLVQRKISNQIIDIKTEQCFNIGVSSVLSNEKLRILKWLLGETYEPHNLQTKSFLDKESSGGALTVLVEVGPRLSFTTAWSANAVSICQSCTLTEVTRLERSRRYMLYLKKGSDISHENLVNEFAAMVHDRMTECIYPCKLLSFKTTVVPEPVSQVPVIERGPKGESFSRYLSSFSFSRYLFKQATPSKNEATGFENFELRWNPSNRLFVYFFRRRFQSLSSTSNTPICSLRVQGSGFRKPNREMGFFDLNAQ